MLYVHVKHLKLKDYSINNMFLRMCISFSSHACGWFMNAAPSLCRLAQCETIIVHVMLQATVAWPVTCTSCRYLYCTVIISGQQFLVIICVTWNTDRNGWVLADIVGFSLTIHWPYVSILFLVLRDNKLKFNAYHFLQIGIFSLVYHDGVLYRSDCAE